MTARPAPGPAEALAFGYRQGPGKRLLGEQRAIDDTAPTTAYLPPPHALGATGTPLPGDPHDLLADTAFPGPLRYGADPLGAALATAFGLQRREPDHQFPDHRGTASGRARHPVHALLGGPGVRRYLDPYRRALVDLTSPPAGGEAGGDVRGEADDRTRLVLAARYSDLPAAYGSLRFAVCEAELGVNLRAWAVTAQAFGVPGRLEADDAPAERLIAAAGTGRWSAPLSVELTAHHPGPSRPLPGPAPAPADHARFTAADPDAEDCRALSRCRTAAPAGPLTGIPAFADAPGPSWAEVLWRRSAGRVPGRRYGFALRPAPVAERALRDLLAWAAVPPPDALTARVAERIRRTVVLQNVAGLPDGAYRLTDGRLTAHRPGPGLPARLEPGFGRPDAPDTGIALRHAGVLYVHSAEPGALVEEFGPAALALAAQWCGWAAHGLCLAAAAHGLVARPARSYDEHHLQPLLGLDRKEVPVFMTVCGTPRYTGPLWDLRG
ncbi:hypothetical protein ACFRAR_10945 [Kitasatospora sp. NPDC056651]|uniref:hypothetical protein n=1 Tax=Kitasatospora sp. NPDC056651 TaxID=3345892 RepID=UPI0036B224CC